MARPTSTAGNKQQLLLAPAFFPARVISIPALMGGIPAGHGSGWHQPLRVAGLAQPIPLSMQVVQPGAVSGGRGVSEGQLRERSSAPGQRPGVREQPALSARGPRMDTRWVAIQKISPIHRVPANFRCGGMSHSTRGQTESFRSDPHLPQTEIQGFEVS